MLARGPRVALLAYRGAVAFDFVTVHEIFGLDYSERFGSWYDATVCAPRPGPVDLGDGLTVLARRGLDAVDGCDLVIVPGWSTDEPPPRDLLLAVRRAHLGGAKIMSICTGAFVLGHAGLLDGHTVTTHWSTAERLAQLFPRATVDPRALFIDDGSILTSAGMSAGIDLSLHVVRSDYGADVAADLARRLVVAAYRSGGQAQFVEHPLVADADDPLSDLLAWMRDHLGEQQPLTMLAARVHVSPRTLTRQFQRLTGTTPHQWLIRERVLAVQRLLEVTDEPIGRIARRTGFPSTTNMRLLFRRHVGAAPQSYRLAHRCRSRDSEAAC